MGGVTSQEEKEEGMRQTYPSVYIRIRGICPSSWKVEWLRDRSELTMLGREVPRHKDPGAIRVDPRLAADMYVFTRRWLTIKARTHK